jgi:hypothetical protein
MPEGDGTSDVPEGREDPVGTDAVGEAGVADDERELLEAFDRLAPKGTPHWLFDDAMRRLSTPGERATWIEPWSGLPADLWDRGRRAKASEGVLGDVVKAVAQNLTEYSQRIVDDVRRTTPEESTVADAFHQLAARIERLESVVDPLGIRPAELDLPSPDIGEWAAEVPNWLGGPGALPVLVGEIGVHSVLDALVAAGTAVDSVDPRGARVWALGESAPGRPGQVHATLSEVIDHLRSLPIDSRSGVVLSGGVDRVTLAGKVDLVDAALRVLVPGGTLVVLTVDQAAWDTGLAPSVRDLLPGRPLHPDAWVLVLERRGLSTPEVHVSANGNAHAIVARTAR